MARMATIASILVTKVDLKQLQTQDRTNSALWLRPTIPQQPLDLQVALLALKFDRAKDPYQ